MKRFLFAAVAVIAVLFGIMMMLPSEYKVERSLTMDAPAETIFAHVNDFKQWPNWMPWIQKDPNMALTFGENTQGEGGWYSWQSDNDEVGNGKLSIVESQAGTFIKTKLEFEGMDPGYGSWTFEPSGDQTTVTWGMEGDMGMNPIGKVIAQFMDGMVGPDFEKGLASIKEITEKEFEEVKLLEMQQMAADSSEVEGVME
ncbi:MAG: SRPBCC family protein [Bacteroidota bacterium]